MLTTFAVLVGLLAGCDESGGPVEVQLPPLPARISSLAEGIRLVIEREYEPTAGDDPGPDRSAASPRTLWVLTETEPVRVVEFGVFALIDGVWVPADADESARSSETFAEWLRCEGALLKVGKAYFSAEAARVRELASSRPVAYRWYVIGESERGLLRGEVTLNAGS